MRKSSRLYNETLLRVGPGAMRGVDRLLEKKHRGIAEKHTVHKLITYVESLEDQLGVNVSSDSEPSTDFIRLNKGGISRYIAR